MKFEIKTENVPEVTKHLERFIKLCQDEYKKQLGGATETTMGKFYSLTNKVARNISPIKPPDLPSEILIMQEKVDEQTIHLTNSLAIPKTLAKLGRVHIKMEKNLLGYLQAQGFDATVKYIGD